MSLINDALKQSEADKLHPGADADGQPEPKHIKRDFSSPPHKIPRSVPVLVVLAAASLAFGIWRVIGSIGNAGPPASASAVVASPVRAATTKPARPETRPATAPAIVLSPEAQEVIDKTMAAVTYYQPPESPPAATDANQPPIETARADLEHSPKPPAQPEPAPPEPKVDPSSYKLSGILTGADGGTAIVNGRFLKVGQTVNGAKVVKITSHAVHLEVSGQVITIGM